MKVVLDRRSFLEEPSPKPSSAALTSSANIMFRSTSTAVANSESRDDDVDDECVDDVGEMSAGLM